MQLRDLQSRAHTQCRIEIRQRLIEQEQLRLLDDRAADRDALSLATRDLAGLALQQVFDLQHLRRRGRHAVRSLRGACARCADRTTCSRARSCADTARSAETPSRRRARRAAVDRRVWPPMRISPSSTRFEPRDHPQQRRLAAAGRTQKHHELVGPDRQRYIVDDLCLPESLADIDDLELATVSAAQFRCSRVHRICVDRARCAVRSYARPSASHRLQTMRRDAQCRTAFVLRVISVIHEIVPPASAAPRCGPGREIGDRPVTAMCHSRRSSTGHRGRRRVRDFSSSVPPPCNRSCSRRDSNSRYETNR